MKNFLKYLSICLSLLVINSTNINAQSCTYCDGGTIPTLEANCTGGIGPVTYIWQDPSANITAGFSVLADEAGTWTWTCTDSLGCSSTGDWDVFIEAEPAVIITATDACVDATQTISATVIASAQYNWDFGTDAAPSGGILGSSNSVSYSTAGTKTITLTLTTLTGCIWVYTTTIEIGQLEGSVTCE